MIFFVVVVLSWATHAYPEYLSTMAIHFFPIASNTSMAICFIGVLAVDGGVCFSCGLGREALFDWHAPHASIDEAMLAFMPGQ